MGPIRAVLLFIALLIVGGFWMVVSWFAWMLPGGSRHLNRWFLQSFARCARVIVGLKQVVLNEERIHSRRPAILIGNHQTGTDLAVIGSVCPTASVIVAKKELKYIPLFGWFFWAAGNILIDRSKSKDAKKMINDVVEKLKRRNLNLVIFPEGTRNRHTELQPLLPFKKGAFFLAAGTGLPIIPVVCSSLKGRAEWEKMKMRGGVVVISVMEPIETVGLQPHEIDTLREKVRDQMSQEFIRVNAIAEEMETKR